MITHQASQCKNRALLVRLQLRRPREVERRRCRWRTSFNGSFAGLLTAPRLGRQIGVVHRLANRPSRLARHCALHPHARTPCTSEPSWSALPAACTTRRGCSRQARCTIAHHPHRRRRRRGRRDEPPHAPRAPGQQRLRLDLFDRTRRPAHLHLARLFRLDRLSMLGRECHAAIIGAITSSRRLGAAGRSASRARATRLRHLPMPIRRTRARPAVRRRTSRSSARSRSAAASGWPACVLPPVGARGTPGARAWTAADAPTPHLSTPPPRPPAAPLRQPRQAAQVQAPRQLGMFRVRAVGSGCSALGAGIGAAAGAGAGGSFLGGLGRPARAFVVAGGCGLRRRRKPQFRATMQLSRIELGRWGW
ncbi:hypothetical protein L1887_48825 [Cichorium endivia]|nr:hypothetical protein L1887_48825 [Cichorium endivia]